MTMRQLNLRDVSDETYERLRAAAYVQNATVPAIARAWLDKFPAPADWPPVPTRDRTGNGETKR